MKRKIGRVVPASITSSVNNLVVAVLFFVLAPVFVAQIYAADLVISTATTGVNGGGPAALSMGDTLTISSTGSILNSVVGQTGVNGLHSFGVDATATANNTVTLAGSLQNLGINSYGIQFAGVGNVAHLSSVLSSSAAGSYAIMIDPCTYWDGAANVQRNSIATVNLLRGVTISGDIRNEAYLGSTSTLTFGFATNGTKQANTAAADSSFEFSYSGSITTNATSNWDGYLAGGTTTLSGAANQFRNLYVGGDSFAGTFAQISGATATLNLSNAISTTGTVTVGAGSIYNLSGTHTHSGASFVVNGAMNLSGSALADINAGNLTLGSTGTLTGTGAVEGTVNALAGSTLTPGSTANKVGTITVTGDVTTAGRIALDYTPTTSDCLSVTGNLNLNAAQLNITPELGGQANTAKTLVSAGNLTAAGVTVNTTESSVLINYETTVTTGAAGTVVVTSRAVDGAYRTAATSSNQGLSASMDRLTVNHAADMDGIFDKMNRMTSNSDVNAAMTQLNNSNCASASNQMGMAGVRQSNAALSSQFTSLRQSKLANSLPSVKAAKAAARDTARASAGGMPTDEESAKAARKSKLDSDRAASPYRKWDGALKFYGGFGEEGSSGDATGYDFGGVGALTSLDYAFSQEIRAGVLIDYSYNRANLYNNLGNATDNVLRVGPFASFNWDKLFVDTAPTMGIHMLETERNIGFLNTAAKGERTGCDVNWFNQVGYQFDLPKEIMLTPSYGLGFTAMYDPEYTETGAASGANLKVNEFTSYSLVQNLDLKLGRIFQIGKNVGLLPEVWGGWEHEYLNNAGDITSAFAAAPSQSWTSPVNAIAQDRAVLGAGLTTLITDRWSLSGRYEQRIWQGGMSTNFSAGIKVSF